MVTRGSYGDVVPFLALGRALRSRGHTVTLVTHCHYAGVAREVGLQFASWDTPQAYAEFIGDGSLLDMPATVPVFARRHVLPHTEAEYRLIAAKAAAPRTILLTRHMGSLAAWFAAERLAVPLVVLFTAVAQANCWPLFRHVCQVQLGDSLNDVRRSLGLADIASWAGWFSQPSMFLGSWPGLFARPTAGWPGPVHPLGFLHCDEGESGPLPEDLEQWLAAGPVPVLITGGTARWALSERFYDTAVRACTLAGYRAIVVCPHVDISAGGQGRDDVRWWRRLPFGTLMPRVAAVIHHGGTSILVRAIRAEVPQVALPYGADRPDTASRLAGTGVAVSLAPSMWHPDRVAERLTSVIASPEVRHACVQLAAVARAGEGDLASGCCRIERQLD